MTMNKILASALFCLTTLHLYADVSTSKVGDYKVLLDTRGQFGNGNWKQQLTVEKDGRALYTMNAPHALSRIILIPGACLEADGYTWVGIALIQDGLDGSIVQSIGLNDGQTYVSTAELTRVEPDFDEKVSGKEFASGLPETLAKKRLDQAVKAYMTMDK